MNVGIGAGLGFAGTSVEDWDRVMAVNLRSHFLGCKQALASFDEGGAVVLIGSLAARESMPIPSYAASKAALEAVCRNAAVEGAPRVRVNVLAPGLIDTSLGRLATQLNPARARGAHPGRTPGQRVGDRALRAVPDRRGVLLRDRPDARRRRRPERGDAQLSRARRPPRRAV